MRDIFSAPGLNVTLIIFYLVLSWMLKMLIECIVLFLNSHIFKTIQLTMGYKHGKGCLEPKSAKIFELRTI